MLALVLRSTWLVAHSKPALANASRRSAAVLDASRRLPRGDGKTGVSPVAVMAAARSWSISTPHLGRRRVRWPAVVLVLLLAGGAESMSNAPFYSTDMRWGARSGPGVLLHDALARG